LHRKSYVFDGRADSVRFAIGPNDMVDVVIQAQASTPDNPAGQMPFEQTRPKTSKDIRAINSLKP
jgi:hypothetical protein